MDIADLVSGAADLLVAAVATDEWDAVRREFSVLFGRGRPDGAASRGWTPPAIGC